MTALFTVWNNRVSPVFDVASQGILVEIIDNKIFKNLIALPQLPPVEKIINLQEMGVNEIICGAITCSAEIFAGSNGITVHSFKSGEIDDIIQAWISQELTNPVFSMPGCRRRRQPQNQQKNLQIGRPGNQGHGRRGSAGGGRGCGRGKNI